MTCGYRVNPSQGGVGYKNQLLVHKMTRSYQVSGDLRNVREWGLPVI